MDNHKNVTAKRHTFTKAEREYVKGIVHNLSFQRLTDQEIIQWLHDEKQIDLDRSSVSKMRNQIDKQAEKWYIDLRNSAYRYVAQYEQRIDSLLSYQRTLHEIISNTKKDEVKIRAISELHSIEMDIFNLWKQLPVSNIVSTVDNSENEKGKKVQWAVQIGGVEEQAMEEEKEPVVGFESEPWTVDNNNNNNKNSAGTCSTEPKPEPEITTSLGKLSTDTDTDTDTDLSKESETKDSKLLVN